VIVRIKRFICRYLAGIATFACWLGAFGFYLYVRIGRTMDSHSNVFAYQVRSLTVPSPCKHPNACCVATCLPCAPPLHNSASTYATFELPFSLSSPGRHRAGSVAAQVIILIAEIFVGLATLRQGFSLLRRLDAAPAALINAKVPTTNPDVEMAALAGDSLDGALPESTPLQGRSPPEVGPPEDTTVAVSSRWATPPRVRIM